jgi:hypothetical protein
MKSTLKTSFAGRSIATVLLVLASMALWTACTEDSGMLNPGDEAAQKIVVSGTTFESTPIMAGQNTNAGYISFRDFDSNNDGQEDMMEFCYNTVDGWELAETHFAIGEGLASIPTNRSGNPVPGQFPYKSGTLAAGTTKYCVTIPMSAINFSCPTSAPKDFYIGAHAVVRKVSNGTVLATETGWGQGTRFVTKGNWGMYVKLGITCDVIPPPPPCAANGTAIAKADVGSVCFDSVNGLLSTTLCTNSDAFDIENPARWGWTNKIEGFASTVMTLWAGGALCDTDKGTNVGTATVTYVDGKAKVTINMTNGSLGVAHVYVGEDPLYLDLQYSGGGPNGSTLNCNSSGYTVAPGQQPYLSGTLATGTTTWSTAEIPVPSTFYVYVHIDAVNYCK